MQNSVVTSILLSNIYQTNVLILGINLRQTKNRILYDKFQLSSVSLSKGETLFSQECTLARVFSI